MVWKILTVPQFCQQVCDDARIDVKYPNADHVTYCQRVVLALESMILSDDDVHGAANRKLFQDSVTNVDVVPREPGVEEDDVFFQLMSDLCLFRRVFL